MWLEAATDPPNSSKFKSKCINGAIKSLNIETFNINGQITERGKEQDQNKVDIVHLQEARWL